MVAYTAKYKQSFAGVIKGEFSGALQKVLLSYVAAFEDYPTFLATRLSKTMV